MSDPKVVLLDDYTTTPTHLRIFSDGAEWFLDAVDDQGRFTEACWSYDSFQDAVNDLASFVELQTTYAGVTFQWRPSPNRTELAS